MSHARALWQPWGDLEVAGLLWCEASEHGTLELVEELQVVCQLVDDLAAIAPGPHAL